MGVTGVNGFPCCSKKSVEVVETHEDFQEDSDPQPEPVEDETELLDDTLDLEAEQDLDSESELMSELEPEPRLLPESESELDEEDPVPVNVFVQTSNLAFNLAPKNAPAGPRVNVQIQTAVGPKGTLELSISHEPRNPEPAPVKDSGSHTFRSVFVQTSKHLFRTEQVIPEADAKQPADAGRHPFPMRDWPFQKPRGTGSKESLLSGNKMLMEDIRVQTSHPSLGIEGYPPQTPVQALLPEKAIAEVQSISSPNFSAKFSEPLDFRMFDSRPTSASLPPALVSSTSTSRNSSSTELVVDSQALVVCQSPSGLRMGSRSPMTQGSTTDLSVATEQPASPPPLLKPPEAGEPQKSVGQEFALKSGYTLNMAKSPAERAAMEGEVNRLQSASLAPIPSAPWKEWSPTDDQEIHSDTEMVQLDPRCLEPEVGEDQADLTPNMKKESLASWITQQARARPATEAKSQRRRDLSSLFAPVDIPAEYEHPLTSRQVAAFQDVFQLFKPGSQGKLDMRSMKGALRTLGIQLSPQEVCEALRRADLDGDGAVDFEDFLGILTDNHRFAQCMGRMRNSRINDPHGLETLFFEMMSKFVGQGALSPKSVAEVVRCAGSPGTAPPAKHKSPFLSSAPPPLSSKAVKDSWILLSHPDSSRPPEGGGSPRAECQQPQPLGGPLPQTPGVGWGPLPSGPLLPALPTPYPTSPSYYTDKQRVLRMSSWWKGLNHKHNRSYQSRSHTGLSFFCQATRLTGLNNRQLARSLHNLRDLNVQGPYSQVPNLPPRTRSTERRIRSRGPRLTNLARPCKPKPPPREAPRRAPEPIVQRPKSEEGTAELGPAPSPPTLVQSQLPSPPPATPQSHSLPNVYQ
ncbi:spermatogenesis-associated protein 32 isoform X1 [Sminthopsis crassicaudata]|uniref:spermatogenesis-associated protein 32 isoform X1 n=1 Tax=Sminthopsis crassicaudata TaxID=9301 RepID=UPI003D6810ED